MQLVRPLEKPEEKKKKKTLSWYSLYHATQYLELLVQLLRKMVFWQQEAKKIH